MPAADAGAGLPGELLDGVGSAALHIPEQGLLLPVRQHLAGEDDLGLAAVPGRAAVVAVREDLEAGVRDGPEREIGVVEIDDIRIIVVDQLDGAVVDLVAVSLVGGGDFVLLPVPGAVVGTQRVTLLVELLRVEALPPGPGAVLLRQDAVVGHAGERALRVGPAGRLVPAPGMRRVHAHAQAEAIFAAGRRPAAHDVLLRAQGHGVPALVLAVEEGEVVVVIGQGEEIPRTGLLVELDQRIRVPALRLPFVDPVLEAEAGRVVLRVDVVFVLPAALEVHVAGVPVSVFGLTLRPPVGPDAEFGVAEPFGALPGGEALHRGLPGAGRDGLPAGIDENLELRVRIRRAVLGGKGRCQQQAGQREKENLFHNAVFPPQN